MNEIEKFEICAEAFRLMTGHMAPGKDAASASYPASFDERLGAFNAWNEKYGTCVNALLIAAERILDINK